MTSPIAIFVLVGAHAGKSMCVNGHNFIDGRMEFSGGASQAAVLERVLSYYGVRTLEKAELAALKDDTGEDDTGEEDDAGEDDTGEDDTGEEDDPGGEGEGSFSLSEAIGLLNPEDDEHWTSNNLPSLDKLSSVVGKKVTRGNVEALAPGYTRAKARAQS